MAGIHIPENIHGKDITPLLFHTGSWVREAFVYEGLGTYGNAKPNLTVVSNQYKFIVTYENASLDTVIFRELYDRKEDTDEMNNLVNDPAYSSIIFDLKKYIKNHKKRVCFLKIQ